MPKRILQGTVINRKDKTLTVVVVRRFKHPLYKRTVGSSKKYAVHNPNNIEFSLNSIVSFVERSPVSKTKTWQVIEQSSN